LEEDDLCGINAIDRARIARDSDRIAKRPHEKRGTLPALF
jgi:hypothetical protein